MFNVKEGEKYVVLITTNDENIVTKDIVCKSEITNFQEARMEIETTDGEYYPLYNVYKTRQEALKDYKRGLKGSITMFKKFIKEKEKEIQSFKKQITIISKKLDKLKDIK